MRDIHIGQILADSKPLAIRTILGSCVSACLYDPITHIGGANHILLPSDELTDPSRLEARFGVHAMELLINAMMQLGADRRRLVAKAFGGANVLAGMSSPTVGERNVSFVKDFLKTEGIRLTSH